MEISIATGSSRKTKVWKNQKVSWSSLVKRLREPVSTGESYKEYLSFSKERQSEIKDRGGFVGGYLKDGKRTPGTVLSRQLLTLDMDLADLNFWARFTFYFDCAAVLHSTHKHSEKTPRYRLVIPLDRRVSPEEYEAIGRSIAADLNINIFDPTTFQPERLMYWPTIAKDGDWVFEQQKGEPLAVDQVLSGYEDWSDVSSWPRVDKEKDDLEQKLKRALAQSDPLDKPGLIGAFCRTYDIHEAIKEFLSEIYEETSFPDRYTFTGGSSAAGAIVYDDKFIFSHHGTDPVNGILCNSFDLVRLHLFGHEDTDQGDKEITKRKSYRLMCDYVKDIKAVVTELGVHKLSSIADDFNDGYTVDPDYDNKWLGDLTLDKYHKYDNTIPNFEKIIKNDPHLKGLKYDSFNLRPVSTKPLPWDSTNGQRQWTDNDDAGLRHYLESRYEIYNLTKCKDALSIVFRSNTFHPIQDYLNSLIWDSVERLDNLLIDYLGAEDTQFVRLATRKAFTAAVARVFEPGIKFDYVLTLVGNEGIKKSTILAKMGGKWFSDSFVGVEGNKAYEQLQGAWLIEMGELSGLSRAEAEAVKHFITKRIDRFRIAYGTRIEDFARQCIFFASTNKYAFLKDNNGNRRFWPVRVNDFAERDIDKMPVDQLWAEAVAYYKAGERLYFDADTEEDARTAQNEHTELDERAGLIQSFLDMKLPSDWKTMKLTARRAYLNDEDEQFERGDWPRRRVCVAEIWVELFGSPYKDMTTHNTKYIHTIMEKMHGWEKANSNLTNELYGKQRHYIRTEDAKRERKKLKNSK